MYSKLITMKHAPSLRPHVCHNIIATDAIMAAEQITSA